MLRIFFVIFAVFAISSCSSNEERCGLPVYGNDYYNNSNINPDYPCIIDACGNRICENYQSLKKQYQDYYVSEPCNRQ